MVKRLLAFVLTFIIMFSGIGSMPEVSAAGAQAEMSGVGYCSSVTEAADYVRKQMVARQERIQFFYSGNGLDEDRISKLQNDILEEVCAITDSPQEGDYLRYHFTKIDQEFVATSHEAFITWTVSYTSDAWQENQMGKQIKNAVKSLKLSKDGDVVKVKKIHDYICETVSYYDDGSSNCHSAYSALEEGQTVCQGYATLFYAMAVEAGLEVRCIEGYGREQPHLWNIVRVAGDWYNLDVVWDDTDNGIRYHYFLKSEGDFGNHTRAAEFRKAKFKSAYPVSKVSYTDSAIIPARPKISSISTTKQALRVKWKTVENADGYELLVTYKNGKKIKKRVSVKASEQAVQSKKIKGLKSGKVCSVKVRAYVLGLDGKVYGKYSAVKKKTVK